MVAEVTKILAVGTNKRFMWLHIEKGMFAVTRCVRISDELYGFLKGCGVPTAQSLRKKS